MKTIFLDNLAIQPTATGEYLVVITTEKNTKTLYVAKSTEEAWEYIESLAKYGI